MKFLLCKLVNEENVLINVEHIVAVLEDSNGTIVSTVNHTYTLSASYSFENIKATIWNLQKQ